jgi:hypothetical protein
MSMKISISNAMDECKKALSSANLLAVSKASGVSQGVLFRLVNQPGYKPYYETIKSLVGYIEGVRARGEEIPSRYYKARRTTPAAKR